MTRKQETVATLAIHATTPAPARSATATAAAKETTTIRRAARKATTGATPARKRTPAKATPATPARKPAAKTAPARVPAATPDLCANRDPRCTDGVTMHRPCNGHGVTSPRGKAYRQAHKGEFPTWAIVCQGCHGSGLAPCGCVDASVTIATLAELAKQALAS